MYLQPFSFPAQPILEPALVKFPVLQTWKNIYCFSSWKSHDNALYGGISIREGIKNIVDF